jgi:hypothetical protein
MALVCASCTSVPANFSPDVSSPEATLNTIFYALQNGDVSIAQQCTLYGDYIDWDSVFREAKANPDKFRLSSILYKDDSPQAFTSSLIYYRAKDGHNYVAEFTRIEDKWYWGSRLDKGVATLLKQQAEQQTEGKPEGLQNPPTRGTQNQ